jgi:hypothetical protein
MEPECLLQCPQESTTVPYPEPDASSPLFPTPKTHSNIIFPTTSRFSALFLPFRFPDQNFVLNIACEILRAFNSQNILVIVIGDHAG